MVYSIPGMFGGQFLSHEELSDAGDLITPAPGQGFYNHPNSLPDNKDFAPDFVTTGGWNINGDALWMAETTDGTQAWKVIGKNNDLWFTCDNFPTTITKDDITLQVVEPEPSPTPMPVPSRSPWLPASVSCADWNQSKQFSSAVG